MLAFRGFDVVVPARMQPKVPKPKYDENNMPNFDSLKSMYNMLCMMMNDTKVNLIQSAWAVGYGGVMEAVTKMGFGNNIGFQFNDCCDKKDLFKACYGSVILEVKGIGATGLMGDMVDVIKLGHTTEEPVIQIAGETMELSELCAAWQKPLEEVFATKAEFEDVGMKTFAWGERVNIKPANSFAKPRIFIPAFPGTNCEYDSARAFERAGGVADIQVFKNLKPEHIEDSINRFVDSIKQAQIIMLPGGFSGGDEPDGSGKFIKAAFENERVKDAVMEMLISVTA